MGFDFEFGGNGINSNTNLDASGISRSLKDVKKNIDDTAKSAKEFISVTGSVKDKLKGLKDSNNDTGEASKETKKKIEEQTEALDKNTDAINRNIDAKKRLNDVSLKEVNRPDGANWSGKFFEKAVDYQIKQQQAIDKKFDLLIDKARSIVNEQLKKYDANSKLELKNGDYKGTSGRLLSAINLAGQYNDVFMRKDRGYMKPDLPPIAYAVDYISRGGFDPADIEMSKIQNYLVHEVDNADAVNPFSKNVKLLKDKLDINGNKIGIENAGWKRVGIKNTLDKVGKEVYNYVVDILNGNPINIPGYEKELIFGNYSSKTDPITLTKSQRHLLNEVKKFDEIKNFNKYFTDEQENARKAKEQFDRLLPWDKVLGGSYGDIKEKLIDFASKNLSIDDKTLNKKGDKLGTEILERLGWEKGNRTPEAIKKYLSNPDRSTDVEDVLFPLLLSNNQLENVLKIRKSKGLLGNFSNKDINAKISENILFASRIFDDVNGDRNNILSEVVTKAVEKVSNAVKEKTPQVIAKTQEIKSNIQQVVDAEKEAMKLPAEMTEDAVNEAATEIEQSISNTEGKTGELKQKIKNLFNNLADVVDDFQANMGTTFASFQSTFHGYGMFIRNLSSTIYAVSKMSAGLNEAMSNVDFMIAQSYRMQRYDKTGMSQTDLINRLYNTAQTSRNSLESTSTLTQRLLATGVTNGDPNEALRLATIINKAAFIGGSTPQEAKQAIMQLSQGLASNQLGGDELRSVRENAIGLTEMLSKGLMRAYSQGLLNDSDFEQVDIGKLKELGKKAKLTAQNVITAFSVMEDDVNEAFKNIPQTFGQTLDKLKNTFIKRMYEFSKEGKGFGRIADTIKRLEEFINSEEGGLIIDTALQILDTAIKNLVEIAERLAGLIKQFSGVLPTIINVVAGLMQFKFFSSIFLGGRKFNFGKGVFEDTAGIIGAGGLLGTLTRLIRVITSGNATFSKLLHELTISTATKMVLNKETGEMEEVVTGQMGGFAGAILQTASGNAIGTGLGSVLKDLGGKLAAGGLLSKTGIAGIVTNPIVLAIGGLAVALGVRNSLDKKADEKDLNDFLDNLPNPSHWNKLQDEDRNSLRSKAIEWYSKYTSGKFIGTSRDWSDKDYEKFVRDYLDFGDAAYGRYIKSIADKTGEIAANTASTLDITDEFIRNMNDIRTRSFRGELLMNGNGVNNTWNVVVHNEGDVKNIAEQIQSAVIAAQEGMLNAPVVM